jgi:hypothetical protein
LKGDWVDGVLEIAPIFSIQQHSLVVFRPVILEEEFRVWSQFYFKKIGLFGGVIEE